MIKQGLAVKESEFQDAVGYIVVWVPNDLKLDVERLGIETLTDQSVRKIAIANPMHPPSISFRRNKRASTAEWPDEPNRNSATYLVTELTQQSA